MKKYAIVKGNLVILIVIAASIEALKLGDGETAHDISDDKKKWSIGDKFKKFLGIF